MQKTALFIFTLFFVTLSSCDNEDTELPITPSEPQLTEQEKADLTFSREQEKLSRDVYLYAYAKYQNPIHLKVSGSQQVRMDELKALLEKHELADPASQDTGVFSTTELQDRYNDLITQADISLEMAIISTMTVEDRGMSDIETYISNTEKEDVLYTYDFMHCTSKNHIRWLYPELQLEGGTYTPQFISQEEYNEITNSPLFQCR